MSLPNKEKYASAATISASGKSLSCANVNLVSFPSATVSSFWSPFFPSTFGSFCFLSFALASVLSYPTAHFELNYETWLFKIGSNWNVMKTLATLLKYSDRFGSRSPTKRNSKESSVIVKRLACYCYYLNLLSLYYILNCLPTDGIDDESLREFTWHLSTSSLSNSLTRTRTGSADLWSALFILLVTVWMRSFSSAKCVSLARLSVALLFHTPLFGARPLSQSFDRRRVSRNRLTERRSPSPIDHRRYSNGTFSSVSLFCSQEFTTIG